MLLIFFSKNINVFAIFQKRNFQVTLANNFVNWALSVSTFDETTILSTSLENTVFACR